MSQLKGNTVYMIIYNYNDKDYSVIKIMDSLEKAFDYICSQEQNGYLISKYCKLIEVKDKYQVDFPYDDDCVNVCYVTTCKYTKLEIYNRADTSQYVIVPMDIC
jgi:hypothetical protein